MYERKYGEQPKNFEGLVNLDVNNFNHLLLFEHRTKLARKANEIEGWWRFYQGWAETFKVGRERVKGYKGKTIPYPLGHLDLLGGMLGLEHFADMTVADLIMVAHNGWLGYTSYVANGHYGNSVGIVSVVVLASAISAAVMRAGHYVRSKHVVNSKPENVA